MGLTPNYDIPYPECAPPLREDASDVADMRDLAEAADTALSGVYDLATELVFNPEAVRVSTAASVGPVTGQNVTPFYNLISFQRGTGMADITNGWVVLPEPGRYWIGAFAQLTAAGIASPRLRFLFNGAPVTNFQTPGIIASGNTATAQSQVVLATNNPGTVLQAQVRHSSSAALSYTYTSRLWVLQLQRY